MAKADGVRWDLADLYEGISDPRVEKDLGKISAGADRFEKKYRGKIKSPSLTAGELAGAVRELERLSEGIGRILSFAYLLFAADTQTPETGAFRSSMQQKATEVQKKLIFFVQFITSY